MCVYITYILIRDKLISVCIWAESSIYELASDSWVLTSVGTPEFPGSKAVLIPELG